MNMNANFVALMWCTTVLLVGAIALASRDAIIGTMIGASVVTIVGVFSK